MCTVFYSQNSPRLHLFVCIHMYDICVCACVRACVHVHVHACMHVQVGIIKYSCFKHRHNELANIGI